jgi:hypothetical protein
MGRKKAKGLHEEYYGHTGGWGFCFQKGVTVNTVFELKYMYGALHFHW